MDWTQLTQNSAQWRSCMKKGNESSGSIKVGRLIDYLIDLNLLKGEQLQVSSIYAYSKSRRSLVVKIGNFKKLDLNNKDR